MTHSECSKIENAIITMEISVFKMSTLHDFRASHLLAAVYNTFNRGQAFHFTIIVQISSSLCEEGMHLFSFTLNCK